MILDRIPREMFPVQGFILSRAYRSYTTVYVVRTLPLVVGYSVMIFTQALIKDKSDNRFLWLSQAPASKHIETASKNIKTSVSWKMVWSSGEFIQYCSHRLTLKCFAFDLFYYCFECINASIKKVIKNHLSIYLYCTQNCHSRMNWGRRNSK